MPRRSKLTLFHDLIGTVPDREVAVMAEVSIASVCSYRKRHSIPSFRSMVGMSAEVIDIEEAAAEAPAAEPLQGYAATIETDAGMLERFLMAENLAAAAAVAMKVGRVTRLTHLGPALI